MRLSVSELLAYCCADTLHASTDPLLRWLNASPRFATFVDDYRDKVRKKFRVTRDAEGFRDVLCELETAYWLLQESRFTLAYEPYNSEQIRGPDFTVAFKTHAAMNVEVAHMRSLDAAVFDPPREGRRLTDIVCGKLSQMLPSIANLLVIVADSRVMDEIEVQTAMLQLKERAERQDTSLFARHNFRSRADFFKFYQRLSGVMLRGAWDQAAHKPPTLWMNKQAKHPLTANICRILLADSQISKGE